MEKLTFDNIVGFILALAFALVMATCMWAVLVGDYMQPNSVMNETTRHTLQIVGYAGGLAALVAGGSSNSPPRAASSSVSCSHCSSSSWPFAASADCSGSSI
jgi:hypothetical protein